MPAGLSAIFDSGCLSTTGCALTGASVLELLATTSFAASCATSDAASTGSTGGAGASATAGMTNGDVSATSETATPGMNSPTLSGAGMRRSISCPVGLGSLSNTIEI